MNIVTVTCATTKCCEPIYMPEEKVRQYRATGASFHCQKGHSNYFPRGPSEESKLKKQIVELNGMLASANRRIFNAEREVNWLRSHFLETIHEPGIYQTGRYEHVWVCTCHKRGHGTNLGEEHAMELLLAHQKRMHCNPIPGLEITT